MMVHGVNGVQGLIYRLSYKIAKVCKYTNFANSLN
jgi:hypothetical protein